LKKKKVTETEHAKTSEVNKHLPKNNEKILSDKRQRNGGEKQKYKEIAI
jgi:hypothetical protein